MSPQPFMPMTPQQRMAVLCTALLLHVVLGWLLLGRSQVATPPVLDMPPVNVALLKAASFAAAPAPAPKASPVPKTTQAAPQPLTPQTLQPVTAPVPTSPVAPPPSDIAPAPVAIAPTTPAAASTIAPSTSKPSNTGLAAGVSDAAASLVSGSCTKAQYPMASRRMEEEGTVTLRFRVEADGQVSQSEVQNSSGFKRLDEAARAGLSRCRFSPALAQGQATASWATIRYTWRLE